MHYRNMRILIAESKSMTGMLAPVSTDNYKRHKPYFDDVASEMMSGWSRWKCDEITTALKISTAMAVDFITMARRFVDKTTGETALRAFTGIVFKGFSYETLPEQKRLAANRSIDIISSAYGWLRGDDIVKPYRLDFSPRLAPGDLSMANFWKSRISTPLLESMEESGEKLLLDLLPGDAAKCLDWSAIRRQVNVVKVDFRSVTDGGKLKTPHSTLLKKLRGELLRDVILKDIRTLEELREYHSEKMYADPNSDLANGTLTILVDF